MAGKTTEEVNVVENVKPQKVPYMIPLSPNPKDERFVYAALNGKGYKIRKGVTVMIPLALKEILDNSAKETYRAMLEAERIQAEMLENARNLNIV